MSTTLPKNLLALPLLAALALCFGAGAASAASFTIGSASSSGQSLGANQTGSVTASGALSVGGGTVAVTITGNNASLSNLGSIVQTGTGRVIRDNTGVTGLVISNGSLTNSSALLQSADADVIQMNVAGGGVTLNNYGSMISLNPSKAGSQAVDFNAISTGANTLNNFAGGLIKASEADAVRTGVNGIVDNAGTILSTTTSGSSSDGIDLQTNSGALITNRGTGLIEGGRHAITGGALNATTSFAASITNLAGGVIQGANGSGLNFDGFNGRQLVTVVNGGSIIGRGVSGDGDGIDVDGLVHVTNTGLIRSVNAFSNVAAGLAFSEGMSVGGGTIINSGTIEGLVSAGNSNALGRGITLAGNDITSGALAGTREAIYGNAVITNNAGGLIRGQSDSAIYVAGPASGFTVSISNQAGATIQGGGATAAAIRTGFDNDTLVNRGTIDGSSSGRAIDLGGGDNSLRISGGAAVVLGDISGGSGGRNVLTVDAGTGNTFAYAGALSNFAQVEIQSGTVVLSGASSYTGSTTLSGGTLVLDGADRLSAASALVLDGGMLELRNAGAAGQTLASLSLSADSVIDLNGSSLTFLGLGAIASGKTLSLLDDLSSGSSGYALRLLGNVTGDASFQSLLAGMTIDGRAVSARFDGAYTDITAVPEPASVALMLAGLGLLGWQARRRVRAG